MVVGGKDGGVVDGEGTRECGVRGTGDGSVSIVGAVDSGAVGGDSDVGNSCAVAGGMDGGVVGPADDAGVGGAEPRSSMASCTGSVKPPHLPRPRKKMMKAFHPPRHQRELAV